MQDVDALDALTILVAAVGAGAINAVVGSGTLITFPTLIALGYPPLIANVSNNVGLVPGALTGTIGYRRELRGQGKRLTKLLLFSVLGGLSGSIALLALPSSAFDAIVPVLLILALIMVVIQKRLVTYLADRRGESNAGHPAVRALIFGTGVYGGYFGAAQGILLLGILGVALPDSLQRLNALKNVLAGSVNLTAAIIFILVADLDWAVVGLIAAGATCGGWLGGNYGRHLPDRALRTIIVIVGSIAIWRLLA